MTSRKDARTPEKPYDFLLIKIVSKADANSSKQYYDV